MGVVPPTSGCPPENDISVERPEIQTALGEGAVLLYLDNLEAAQRNPKTVDGYRRYLLRFVRRLSTFPAGLDVRDYLDTFKSPNTRAFVLTVLRQWFAFLTARGLIDLDPSAGIPIPKTQRRDYPPVSGKDFQSLQEALQGQSKIIAHLFYGAGTRLAETLALRVEDVAFEGDYGTITLSKRKGGVAGFAAFGPLVTNIVRPYLVGKRGGLFTLSQSGIQYHLAQAGRKAEIPGVMTPHRLRHAFLTWAADHGWNQLALQQQAGHSSPRSTAWYYRPSRAGLIEAYRRASSEWR